MKKINTYNFCHLFYVYDLVTNTINYKASLNYLITNEVTNS